MNFDQERYNAELRAHIQGHSVTVKRISDKELMTLYEQTMDDLEKHFGSDPALNMACYNEYQRRYFASAWFWRRWFNRKRYQDWKDFADRMEAKAMKLALQNPYIREG